jgi:CubicO group peptidase (beta-lactamase class C family)
VDAEHIARSVCRAGVAPLCAAGCAARSGLTRSWRAEVGGDTGYVFDLASVTKPMTAVAVVRAGIDRRTPLEELLPDVRGTASGPLPLELFLAHRAGLEAHRALYAPLLVSMSMSMSVGEGEARTVEVSAALREVANARRPDAQGDAPEEGFAPLYSDLGYVLVGAALARAVGARDAGEAIARLVLDPLGLGDRAGTVRELQARGVRGPFAPTETVAWRGGAVVGAVHDENAWALTGIGGSGHAGIFATVDAVIAFGEAVLDDLDELEWLVRPRAGGSLRAGFDGKSPQGSSAGACLGPRSFGHLGFTGTSLWIDPDARVVVTLLTNRVCPTREHLAIRDARPRAHDELFARAVALRG